jgi:hypothetical protein
LHKVSRLKHPLVFVPHKQAQIQQFSIMLRRPCLRLPRHSGLASPPTFLMPRVSIRWRRER